MNATADSEDINRRRFLGLAAMSIAGSEFIGTGVNAQSGKLRPASGASIKSGTITSFASLKQIDAGVPDVIAAIWPERCKAPNGAITKTQKTIGIKP
jgi:hypothetical protein